MRLLNKIVDFFYAQPVRQMGAAFVAGLLLGLVF